MQATVHFQKIKDEIIRNLKNANKEVKVAVAWLTDEDIIRTLGQRSIAGVDVTVVISDSKENFKNANKFRDLIRTQSQLYIVTPRFLHHKFCIVDDNIIINGSYNWTYYAQSNEENILVLTLDKASPEDENLLTKFNAKFKYLCEKAAIKVIEPKILDEFLEIGKVASVVLSQIDDTEIKLRQDLEDDVKKSFDQAIAIHIPISTLLLERMKLDGGGVEFIKRILHDEMTSGDMKSGFKKLEEPIPHRVDLSLEYLASRPKYENLFSKDEVEFCKKLMKKYNLLV